ncbi:MAG: transposase [Oscillospiraceae bacterium]|nr:transposase [Oscillospiraceae bacterium]
MEDYLRKFGCYPAAVLADKIYQTRANRLYCIERGIRLSGLPLGRWKASKTDVKIRRRMYQDSPVSVTPLRAVTAMPSAALAWTASFPNWMRPLKRKLLSSFSP